jgi:hypothetical protein
MAVSNFFLAVIFAAQGAPVSLTSVANGKIFNQKSFRYFFGHLWVVELTSTSMFFFNFTLRCLILFPSIAAGAVDTGGAP